MNNTNNQVNGKVFNIVPIVAGGVVIGLIIGGSLFLADNQGKSGNSTSTSSLSSSSMLTSTSTKSSSSSSSKSNASSSTSTYKDGTYTTTTSYSVPDGIARLEVEITIKNGLINSVSVANTTNTDNESKQYTQFFSSGINSRVVGKSLDDAYVSGSINGASLTGNGFNKALDDIINQAK